MIKKAKEIILNKLTSKQIIEIVIIIVLGIWMVLSLKGGFKIPLWSGGFIECGSQPADVKVNYEKTKQ